MDVCFAPIVLFVYSRPEHTRRVIEALAANRGAEKSKLLIFSDGPKNDTTIRNVQKVREYIRSINSMNIFSQVIIHESETNKGLANSIIDGVSLVLKEYDRVIVLEDDVITAPDFIEYMNNALSYFKDNGLIWSISGYSHQIKLPKGYNNDIYLSYRACSCAWGTWRDRWEKVDWQVRDYEKFKKNYLARMAFNRGGADLSKMLDYQMQGKIDSWAIRWCYSQFKHGMLTVYPVISRVKNIGFDGSGTHSGISTKWEVNIYCEKRPYRFENVKINSKITKEFKKIYKIKKIEYAKAAIRKLINFIIKK